MIGYETRIQMRLLSFVYDFGNSRVQVFGDLKPFIILQLLTLCKSGCYIKG